MDEDEFALIRATLKDPDRRRSRWWTSNPPVPNRDFNIIVASCLTLREWHDLRRNHPERQQLVVCAGLALAGELQALKPSKENLGAFASKLLADMVRMCQTAGINMGIDYISPDWRTQFGLGDPRPKPVLYFDAEAISKQYLNEVEQREVHKGKSCELCSKRGPLYCHHLDSILSKDVLFKSRSSPYDYTELRLEARDAWLAGMNLLTFRFIAKALQDCELSEAVENLWEKWSGLFRSPPELTTYEKRDKSSCKAEEGQEMHGG